MSCTSVSGIYLITNLLDNKHYVGSAVNIQKRWGYHKQDLRKNRHINKHLQHAWNKYGEAVFRFEILETTPDSADLITIEQYYLDWLEPEYNVLKIANNRLGVKHSLEARARMSAAHTGHVASDETKAKMSTSHTGMPRTIETRTKISATLKGRVLSTGNKGHHHSEEARARMSAAHKGHRISEETKAKMSSAAKAWWAQRRNGECQ